MSIRIPFRYVSMILLTMIASLVSATASAKTRDVGASPTSCPVSMNDVHVDHNVLIFYYQNMADKDVDAVMFDAAYYDRAHIVHHIDVWGNYTDIVHAGKHKKGALEIKFLKDSGYTGVALWPTKVLFRDHTSWTMPAEGQTCASVLKEGLEKQAGVLPPETSTSVVVAANGR